MEARRARAAAGTGGAGGRAGSGGGGASGGSGRGGGAGGGARAAAGGGSGGGGGAAGTGGSAPAAPIVLSDDGGWCWFESPRALIQGSRLIVGTVASGWSDASRRGDINAVVHDLATGTTTIFELHDQLELDDHDSPAFLARPDGRIVTLYAKHGSENRFYYRISTANNPASWAAEQTFTPTASTQLTYSNVFMLSAESNRVYDFYRGLDASYKPSYAYSDDLGQTWRSGNVVINVPSTQLHRPYARYASNGTDTIHITYTEAHPRDFDNSIYHVYYKGGTLYRSDGTAIHPLTQGLASPDEGTRIFQGNASNVAWTVDVALDPAPASRTPSIPCRSDRRACRPGRAGPTCATATRAGTEPPGAISRSRTRGRASTRAKTTTPGSRRSTRPTRRSSTSRPTPTRRPARR